MALLESLAKNIGGKLLAGLPPAKAQSDGVIWNQELGIKIPFQYHPESITESKTLNWNTQPILGIGQPLLSYGGGDVRVLRFRILLDAHSSPHPAGHVETELKAIRALTVPYDVSGKPTIDIPEPPGKMGAPGVQYPSGRGRVAGVPPVVKIAVGGRVLKGVIQNLEIEEVLHGTTTEARALRLCTRAYVTFDFIVIEDSRMLVHWAKFQPTGSA